MKQESSLSIRPICFGQHYEEAATGKRRMWSSTEAYLIVDENDRVVDAYYNQAVAEEVKKELEQNGRNI